MRYFWVVIVSFFLVSCGVDQSNPEAVAKEYVDAVYHANLPRFKSLVEEGDYDANDDYRLFTTKESTAKSNTRKFRGGVTLIEIANSYVKDTRSTVRVKVEFKNGDRKLLSIRLHKNGDSWFVNPMSWSNW